MNGRTSAALTAILALTTLAGCLAPAELLSGNDVKTEITAMESKDLADNAAKAWSTTSQLVGVFSVELSESGDQQFPLDLAPGNGKSPAWIYAYTDVESASRAFRVTADGRVVAENETFDAREAGQEIYPLGAWKIDSDAAVLKAASNETFATALKGENVTLAEGVAYMEGMTGWYLAALSKAGSAIAVVNAETGDLVMVQVFKMDFKVPSFSKSAFDRATPLHVEGEGKLDSATPTAEFPFTYPGAGEVTLAMKVASEYPTDGLRWEILDEAGDAVDRGSTGRFMSGGMEKWTVDLDEAGDYTLVLSYRGIPTPIGLGGVSFHFTLVSGEEAPEDK